MKPLSMKHLSMMKGALAGLAMLMLPQAAPAKTVTLDVITQNGKFYQAVADAYVESGTKNKVLLQAPSENYDDVAQRALRAAMIGDPPDVVFMGYNRMQLTVDREIAVPLDGIVGSEQELENLGYLPSVLDMCRCDGKLYGLPFATSIPIIFYNQNWSNRPVVILTTSPATGTTCLPLPGKSMPWMTRPWVCFSAMSTAETGAGRP